MKPNHRLLVFAASAIMLASCQKMVVTGPVPTGGTSGSMQVSSSSLALQLQAGLNSADTSLKWTSVVVAASTITLDVKKGDSTVHFGATPNCKIDLLHPDHSDTIRIPEGHYGHIDFKFLLHKMSNAASLRLQGIYTSNGVSTPIVMEIAEDIELKGSLDSVTINRSTFYVATTKLPLSLIATGITHADLDAATRTNTGSIVISPNTNPALYKQILANFKLAMEQYFH